MYLESPKEEGTEKILKDIMAESLLNFLKIFPKSLKLNKYLGYTPPPQNGENYTKVHHNQVV